MAIARDPRRLLAGAFLALLAIASSACPAPPPAVELPPDVPPPAPPASVAASPRVLAVAVSPSVEPPLPPPPPPPALPELLSSPGGCRFARPPPRRTGGDLEIDSPPPPRGRASATRLRTHTRGSLSHGAKRVWVGEEVPPFVLVSGGTRELFLLDEAPDGFVGLYRDPYNAGSCTLGGNANCSFGVALFECSGRTRWLFLLDPMMSRKDHLEVQDVRYADGVLYFNEACQSYSREAQGKCSSLVAVEPLTQRVLWRTRPLVSNNVFVVAGDYLITGYGFTAEPDALFFVRRSDGRVTRAAALPNAHQGMELGPDGVLAVTTYDGSHLRFRVDGAHGDKPKLVALPRGPAGSADPLDVRH
jgi:hypothetical protein